MKAFLFGLAIISSVIAHSQFTKANLQASGLTCALCSNAVNKALQKLSFVASVKPDIKNSSFDISFKENSDINIDDLKNAVEDAGFSVASLKLTGNFDNVKLIKNDYTKIGDHTFYFLNANNEILQGEKTLTIVEKSFMTASTFKKYSAALKTLPGQSAKAEDAGNKLRVYHAVI